LHHLPDVQLAKYVVFRASDLLFLVASQLFVSHSKSDRTEMEVAIII